MNLQAVIFNSKKAMQYKYFALCFMLFSGSLLAQTTEDNTTSEDPYKFTVDQDILNLKFEGDATVNIQGASGKQEDVNRTPYTATVLTREEIENAGALTIPEALRLAPGLFVQQTVNGLYEVYIQGTEALPTAGNLSDARSKMVLVMIDNMPVNNYFDAGVLWETLPVSLNDVERIEIIRSPANVFFGRDAACGVINIITRTPESNKISVQGSAQRSFAPNVAKTTFSNASVGLGIRDKFFVRLSGNYNSTRRFQDELYVFDVQRYVQSDSLLFYRSTADKTNLYGSLARQDYAVNAFLRFVPNENVEVTAALANQNSEAQTIYGGFEEFALSRRTSVTNFANFNARIHKLNVQASYTFGDQNLATGYPGYQFDIHKLNSRIYYTINIKNFRIMPGASYQETGFNDEGYHSTDAVYPDIIHGNRKLSNYGFFVKGGASFLEDKLVVDGGVRKDFFSYNDQSLLSYQGAVAYYPIERVLLRAAYAKGGTGNFARDIFDESISTTVQGVSTQRVINPALTGSSVRNIEVGTRVQATDKILVSIDYFMTRTTNLTQRLSSTDSTGSNTYERVNATTALKRNGITPSVTANFSSKFKLRAFATLQHTNFKSDTTVNHNNYTPKYFGGITGTFRTLLEKLTVGASVYLYDSYAMKTTRGEVVLPSKVIPNLKVSYKFWQESTVYINARNFLDDQSKEYIFSDDVPAMYLVGVNLNF
jgi:iron complex outermembrane receptor protein